MRCQELKLLLGIATLEVAHSFLLSPSACGIRSTPGLLSVSPQSSIAAGRPSASRLLGPLSLKAKDESVADASAHKAAKLLVDRSEVLKLGVLSGIWALSGAESWAADVVAQPETNRDFNEKVSNQQGAGSAGLKTLSNTGVKYSGRMDGKDNQEPGAFFDELLGSDGQPVLISFQYPKSWKLTRRRIACSGVMEAETCSSGDITAKDIESGMSSFIIVAPAEGKTLDSLDVNFFKKHVYGKDGKYGAYGAPDEVKIAKKQKIKPDDGSGELLFSDIKFTAFTPNMRTLEKRSLISSFVIGPDVYMLISTSNLNRWKGDEPIIRKLCDSFRAAAAPKRKR